MSMTVRAGWCVLSYSCRIIWFLLILLFSRTVKQLFSYRQRRAQVTASITGSSVFLLSVLFSPSITTLLGRHTMVPPFSSICLLFHTQMIGALCRDHTCLTVFDLTDICIVDFNHLILFQRISSIFFSVYSNADGTMTALIYKRHSSPHRQCKNKNTTYKINSFSSKYCTPSFYNSSNVSFCLHHNMNKKE